MGPARRAASIQAMKNRRSSLAVLAVGALVASLLAVGAAPAGAVTDWADHTTKLSACVGDADADQGFADVSEGHVFRDAINCIAYYGITLGTGDGSRFSPNRSVTRAQMAVFMARAAELAGVDLGEADDAGFGDIDGVWQEAQDAINRLANKEMIPKGRKFRPDDAVTRGEMATFLVGLLVAAAPNVTKNSAGEILLRSGVAQAALADDYFPDARDTLPRPVDAEVAALYELGVTKGASPAAVRDPTKPPLDFNYQPAGLVNRGQMAVFITRALAHTSVRPTGISAQFDGTYVVLSARDDDFQPVANAAIDAFRIDTEGVDLAFGSDGSCDDVEVEKVGNVGTYVCEIDNTDHLTGGDGDANVALGKIDKGGTTVWAWTGDNEDAVDDKAMLYQFDIDEEEVLTPATRVRVSTEFTGAKAHLGSSVIFTVQLQDAKGDVRTGIDGRKSARFLVTVSKVAIISDGTNLTRSPQGALSVSTLPLTTNARGKATFSVTGLADPDPTLKRDKYAVDIQIQPRPNGNAPAALGTNGLPLTGANAPYFIDSAATGTAADGTGLVAVRSGAGAGDNDYTDDPNDLIFSTESSSHAAATVSVKPAAKYVAASDRGASNRATVTVVDQYADPIAGAEVTLTSSQTAEVGTIAHGRALAVGRDGSYTFSYERVSEAAATEKLTATWDHDGDGCDSTVSVYSSSDNNCPNWNHDGDNNTVTITGTGPIKGEKTVEWAKAATTDLANQTIQAFDTETNTIFAGTTGNVWVITYDSNDRFDVGASGSESPSTYAGFERALFEKPFDKKLILKWEIAGTGSRAINKFTLTTP